LEFLGERREVDFRAKIDSWVALTPKRHKSGQVEEKEATMKELRQYERVDFLCKLQLTEMPSGKPQAARSLDLSLGGVGILTQAAFPVGQIVTVTFFLNDSVRGVIQDPVVGRVTHFRADVEANRLGVQFLQPLNQSEHERLFNRLVSA
jgi:c-di-GMP-binding flagellar brake protein YcgR